MIFRVTHLQETELDCYRLKLLADIVHEMCLPFSTDE